MQHSEPWIPSLLNFAQTSLILYTVSVWTAQEAELERQGTGLEVRVTTICGLIFGLEILVGNTASGNLLLFVKKKKIRVSGVLFLFVFFC